MMRRLPRQLCMIGPALAMLVICASALAFFSSNGSGTASAAVASLGTPTITAATPATGGTVTLTWKAVASPNGEPVTYYVTRDGIEASGSCPGEEEPEAGVTSCIDSGVLVGTHEYTVTALWNTWTKTSPVVSAKVTVGSLAKFAISGSTTAPATGAAVNLTLTAQDENGGTVTTYTGSHKFTFSGAAASPGGTAPTVSNSSGTAIAFGTQTALTFTNGVATISSTKNGVMRIYKAGPASITATEGSITTPTPLALNVSPAVSKYVVTAAATTPTVGAADNLTITAQDAYANTATAYTGAKSLIFSGAVNSPNGTVPTVTGSGGAEVAFGTATPISFTNGVAAVSGGANGALRLYKSAAATAVKATEGTITGTAATITPVAAAAAGLTLTSSATSFAAGGAANLTVTAKDVYGNTAVSYSGAKNLTYSGAATSPSGTVPTVVNSAGTAVNFGTATAITFTNGVAAAASSKNGYLHLYKAESPNIVLTDGTFTTPAVAFTVTPTTASKVALVAPAASPGALGSPCFFTCAVTGTGNGGQISAGLAITDAYGNTVSNLGAGKTATVTTSPTGVTGGTITGGALTFPETGPALSPTRFTFTAAGVNTVTNTITAASTGYTSATISAAK